VDSRLEVLVYSGRHASLEPVLRNFLPGAVLLAMIVASFVGLFLGWTSRGEIVGAVPLSSSRKVVSHIGLFAVTTQALLFIALWTPLVRCHVLLSQSVNLERHPHNGRRPAVCITSQLP